MFETKFVKKTKHTFYVQERYSENSAVYKVMWKKYGTVRQATDDRSWITKAT
jgi:hypothetical protein